MTKETAKAINELSRRLFAMEQKLDAYFLSLHDVNKGNIETNAGGIVDMADILSTHDEAITELAELLSAESEEVNG